MLTEFPTDESPEIEDHIVVSLKDIKRIIYVA
nr:MAG TPA_asm: hypothetical protein [Caudoviricetes sp.]